MGDGYVNDKGTSQKWRHCNGKESDIGSYSYSCPRWVEPRMATAELHVVQTELISK